MRVLVLDTHYQPLGVINWTKAMSWIVLGKAEVVETSDQEIRSPSRSWKLPSVIRKMTAKFYKKREVSFSREAIFIRDEYCCQYCGTRKIPKELTFDHVTPLAQGGETTWENIVAACRECNTKKAGRTPKQARMNLLKEPKRPKWSPIFVIRVKDDPPPLWLPYLKAFGTNL